MRTRTSLLPAALLVTSAVASFPATAPAATNVITTVAGTGVAGDEGDGGPATQARFQQPASVAATADGGYLVVDVAGNRIRRVSPSGVITAAAGTGTEGSTDGGGNALAAEFTGPIGIAPLPDGGFLVTDRGSGPGQGRIRRVGPPSFPSIATVAGGGQLPFSENAEATSVEVGVPAGVAVTPDGGFAFTDLSAGLVYKVRPGPNPRITTLAGGGGANPGDGGPATDAELQGPAGLVANADGSYLVTEALGGRLRRIAANGTISTIAGTGAPFSYDLGDGGPATSGQLAGPYLPAVGPGGDVLIPDVLPDPNIPQRTVGSWVRRVSGGIITTAAGTGDPGPLGDGGLATSAQLDGPTSVAFLADGDYLIADGLNHRVRRVDAGDSPAPATNSGAPAAAPARPAAPAAPKLALSKLGLSPRSPRSKSAAKAELTFTLNLAARVSVRLDQVAAGRKSGKKCAKPSRANRKKKSCKRYVKAGSRTVSGRADKNTLTLGALKKRLAKGSYRVTVAPKGIRAKTLSVTVKK